MNRKFKPNRQGITLLFVISMIVLFLLMGTAFVVVSNTFNRESSNRMRSNVSEGTGSTQGNQIIELVMNQLIRGTDLQNVDSPLRANDILADQYGYGIKAYVSQSSSATPSWFGDEAFIQFALNSNPTSTGTPDNSGLDLRTQLQTPLSTGLNGTYGGRVLSFTSGPAKGFSTRIVADAFNANGDTLVFRIPATSISGDTITDPVALRKSEVIINGRDFSGLGAAVLTNGADDPIYPLSLNTDEAVNPNRSGQPAGDLRSTFLTTSNSVNEPWDAPDFATPFLAGFDRDGNLIPSFFRTANGSGGVSAGSNKFHAFTASTPEVDTDGDGENDSYWMDLGLPIATNQEGQRYRPLVAVHIRDLDGLLNVNAHSNLAHTDPTDMFVVANSQGWANNQPTTPRGSGMGPAEINLVGSLNDNATALDQLLRARYGDDGFPGDGTNSFRSQAKLFGHPRNTIDLNSDVFGTVGNLYGSPMDLWGRFRIGSPQSTPDFLDATEPTFPNSLPQIDIASGMVDTAFNNEFDRNPYEMSLNGDSPGDTPFTLQELERILRPNDIDSRLLPERLLSLLQDDTSNLKLFTTDSFDIPMLHHSFVEELDRHLALRGVNDPDARKSLINDTLVRAASRAFAPELYFGLKMDINRPFGDGQDNNGNGVIDEPDEEALAVNTDASGILDPEGNEPDELSMDLNYDLARNTGDASDEQNPRVIFARNLYMLAMLLLNPIDTDGDGNTADNRPEFARVMAQWAVNVVDFRDPDSIHTRFVYDPEPFDQQGWNPDPNNIQFVWGCERPELLITESLAAHNRNTEDTAEDGDALADGDTDLDQRLRPEAFAYFELYNPWVQNGLNQTFDAGLYNNAQGVVLNRTNSFDVPVWRFEIERVDSTGDAEPLRYVYMADPGNTVTYADDDKDQEPGNIEVFFPTSTSNVAVKPGSHAVIGTKGFETAGGQFRTYLGRQKTADESTDLLLDTTTHISFDTTARTLTRYNATSGNSETRRPAFVLIDQSFQLDASGNPDGATTSERQFSLSDPYGGYSAEDPADGQFIDKGDGFVYTTVKDQPLDRAGTTDNNRDVDDMRKILVSNGTSQDFRTIRLQRLANPLKDWDAITNPYLTIDSLEADLIAYNGAIDAATTNEPGVTGAPTANGAISLERGYRAAATIERQLWAEPRDNVNAAELANASHFFEQDLVESLGKTNEAYKTGTQSFPWLTWNNRPFVSHMETMNVPYLAPDRLTYAPPAESMATAFSIDDKTVSDPYVDKRPDTGTEIFAGRYGHLLNFFAGEADANGTNNYADFYKLLDYLEVPSRFAGTESYYLTKNSTDALVHPFNTISHYRVPGKINLNTIPPDRVGANTSVVWQALASQEYSDPGNPESLNWTDFKGSLFGTGAATSISNPFRPADSANLVPGETTTLSGSNCTLLRPANNGGSGTDPLFEYTSTDASYHTERNAAFRNAFRTRLANLTTNKSSVFAGWITVGYFHVDAADAVQNEEVGTQTGDQVRNRGFFIFDRSIPVAYEPGKNHNIDKAIRVKTIID